MSTQKERVLAWNMFPSTWVSLLLAILLFPLGLSLPAWWGWENGPIENTQVIILCAGAFLSWLLARRNCNDRQMHNIWLSLIPVWLLMVGRELSWGRVLFDPVSIGPHGPTFPSVGEIWYGQYVYPIIGVIIVATLIGLWRNFNWFQMKPKLCIPAIDGVLLILAAIASQIVFERNAILALKSYSQMLEEWSELIVYWCMISISLAAGFKR